VRARLIGIAATASALALALPAHATAAKPQIVDPKGDANGSNGQGEITGLPSVSTPVDDANADILSVLFQSTFTKTKVKRVTGFTVTLTLAAAPSSTIFYRVTAKTADCPDLFIEYNGTTTVRCPSTVPTQNKIYTVPKAKVSGSKITWTIPVSAIPNHTTLSLLQGTTRVSAAVITAPQLDEATTTKTFTVGK
jgi:hypothetical protein